MIEDNKTKDILRDAKGWISYRPAIKVLDCSIRDGGLMNDHKFEDEFVKAIYKTCIEAGVDYMELGYKSDKKIFVPTDFGPWKFCDEKVIRKIVGENDSPLKLSVMADAERTDYHTDILKKKDSVIDMIRVAAYIHQLPVAVDMIKDAHDKGYETTINLMAVSTVQECELDAALEVLVNTPVNIIYLVDSFGAFYCEQVKRLIKKYLRFAEVTGKQVGIHAHNNQELAFSNTITGLIEGANLLDATIHGMGRGAGNCSLELLIGFLHNPKYHFRPIIKCIQKYILPLKSKLNWGFQIPYLITGLLNQHPRAAIKFLKNNNENDFISFYDSEIE